MSNVTLDGSVFKTSPAVRSLGDSYFNENTVQDIIAPGYDGIIIVAKDSYAKDYVNHFSQIGRIGIAVFGNTAAATSSNNTYVGKGEGDQLDDAIELGGDGLATISENTISQCLGVTLTDNTGSAGILVSTSWGNGTSGTITNDTSTDCLIGISMGVGIEDTSGVSASGNGFARNETHFPTIPSATVTITVRPSGSVQPTLYEIFLPMITHGT